jgi:hypothetical protein
MMRTGRLALSLLALLAGRVRGQEPKRETVEASNSAFLTLRVGKAGRSVQLPGKVRFVLDGAAVGAFLQTQADATMRTQPLGVTLSFAPPKPLLSVAYDAVIQKVQVMMRESIVSTVPVELKERRMPLLLMLRQRDQLALFAVPATGGDALLLSLRSADYELRVPAIRDYGLCKNLSLRMGERELTMDEFRKGIALDCLDEVQDVVIAGSDPQGKPFEHAYGLAHGKLLDRLENCYRAVSKKLAAEWQQR